MNPSLTSKYYQSWGVMFFIFLFLNFWGYSNGFSQFLEDFNDPIVTLDKTGVNGWGYATGSGSAQMHLEPNDGYLSIHVDASRDNRNVWWSLIKRHIASNMDLSLIQKPQFDFRIETRIRVSHAPRRVNLHMNTQRTTDFHSHLKEYDIDDTTNWHVISMTTHNFDARPGDTVNAQMALIDWGQEKYRLDMDYFKVDIVKRDTVGRDKGNPLPYHPPVPDTETFEQNISPSHDALINHQFPEMNFYGWTIYDKDQNHQLLTVNGSQTIILRWESLANQSQQINGAGILALTTHSLQKLKQNPPDFGLVRVVEILGGDPDWEEKEVTFQNFTRDKPLHQVYNPQMIIDLPVKEGKGQKNYFIIPEPVMQRLANGKTRGIAIKPLGAINASFFSRENENKDFRPKLFFNLDQSNSMLPGN